MDLAPLTTSLNAMLPGLPFPVAEELDPGPVDEQVQGAVRAAIRDLNSQGLLPTAQGRIVRHGPVQLRYPQQAGHHPCGLPQWQLEEDLDRQASWIAASANTAGRPGLPSCGASQAMSLSSQISRQPRFLSAAL